MKGRRDAVAVVRRTLGRQNHLRRHTGQVSARRFTRRFSPGRSVCRKRRSPRRWPHLSLSGSRGPGSTRRVAPSPTTPGCPH